MKSSIAALLLIMIASVLSAQDFKVPVNYQFETAEDIKAYEPKIKACINWLQSTPLDEQTDKRTNANAFLMAWLTVSPSVKIGVQPYVMELTKKNPDLLMIFFGGWTSHSLENPAQIKNAELNNIKALRSLIDFYAANLKSGIKKEKKIEKLKAMSDDELKEWLTGKI